MTGVRVRFPPSPTGWCHVGTARMAILNYLFAKKNGGAIIFRSEDTDKERSSREFEADIIEQLTWLGLSWDEFYRQSERTEIYKTAIRSLVADGKAYVSEEESKKSPGLMTRIIRLKNPGTIVTFNDVIRGDITFDTSELKDFAIARAEDDPLYHLAVVVDDADMGITHVIRGEDHISNTPRQILIQEALGLTRPVYAHYPLHLSAERSKLSKRSGDVAVRSYRLSGYLPQALLNYLAVLGWTPPSQREILNLEDMVGEFNLADVHKSGAVFDVDKLKWFNREYLHKMPLQEFVSYYLPTLREELTARGVSMNDGIAAKLAPLILNSIHSFGELAETVREGEYDYFFQDPVLDPDRIPEKNSGGEEARMHLLHVLSSYETLDEWSEIGLKAAVWEYATANGRGAVLWPLRYAFSGKEKSPDPFVIAAIIGREAAVRRIKTAIERIV